MKTRFVIATICIAAFAVFNFSGCYNEGYESGKDAGIRKAESEAEELYAPKIHELNAELNKLTRDYENSITAHTNKTAEMLSEHNRLLEEAKKTGYAAGQQNMSSRIQQSIDLDIQNKPAGTTWDDTVQRRKR